jgi:glyoxylase-like metal-dependent hydrolase (beta-lactamase superfamily II)
LAELVAPGVWWLHGTRGSNVYLAEAANGELALVDTGFGSNVDAILNEIALVSGGRPLACILLTHKHLDHAGSALAIRARTGARVVAGVGDCVRRGQDGWAIEPATGRSHLARFVSRRVLRAQPAEVPVDLVMEGEAEVLPGIRAIPTPGHTAGSYCYVSDASGTAFVGDLVISHGGQLSRPLGRSHADPDGYEQSLSALASLDLATGCPGHGQPVVSGFQEALRTLSAAPRRSASPRAWLQQTMKLRAFAFGMYRRRPPPR